MSRSNKGVSMISLVIIIVVTVILLGTAITAGYRYIELGRRTRAQALGITIGSAAYRRQNDLASGVSERYYDGYAFDSRKEAQYNGTTINKYDYIKGIPSGDLYSGDYLNGGIENPNGIPDVLETKDGIWFLIDAESAELLGAPGADGLLTRNISYQMTTSRPQGDSVKVVLANYSAGDGYYVEIPTEILDSCINNDMGDCPNSVNGKHKFTIATCTDDSVCIYCGIVGAQALGHDWAPSNCTSPGSCRRCQAVNPNDPALGHLFIANSDVSANTDVIKKVTGRGDVALINTSDPSQAWIANSTKHWHECSRCGTKFEDEEHTIEGFLLIDETHHQRGCEVCGWTSIKALHTYGEPIEISKSAHKRTCISCLKETTHGEKPTVNPHTSQTTTWFSDCENFHYRVCNDDTSCNKLTAITDSGVQVTAVFKEAHYDNDNDFYCDVCGRAVDRSAPEDFNDEDYNSYFKVKKTNTFSITVEAYTVDSQLGLDYYQFGIYNTATNKVEWKPEKVRPESSGLPVTSTFTGLKNNSPYTFYVKAVDSEGNANTPSQLIGYTDDFPDFVGITGLPTKVVKGPIRIGFEPIKTDLEGLFVQYQQNGGVWGNDISLSTLNSASVTLSLEEERITFRLKDSAGNLSEKMSTYFTNNIDNTAPTVKIEAKEGDNVSLSAAQHFATVTIADNEGLAARAGIAQHTEVQYAWSTSNTERPTEFITIHTENTSTVESITFDIGTPIGANGKYYLWIKQGVKDAVGNATTKDLVSSLSSAFDVDDTEAVITNIEMFVASGDRDRQVPNEAYFVKTNGIVTVTFNVDKKLRQNPIIRINGQDMAISRDQEGKQYTCTIIIDDSFEEGDLTLLISDIVSVNGKLSNKTYTENDIAEGKGPVYYDKTLPIIEYIPKKTP